MIDLNLPILYASTSVCYFLFWMWFIFIIVSGPGSGSWWAIGWPAWDQRGKVVSVSFVPGGESGYRFVPYIHIDGRINHQIFRFLVLRISFFLRGSCTTRRLTYNGFIFHRREAVSLFQSCLQDRDRNNCFRGLYAWRWPDKSWARDIWRDIHTSEIGFVLCNT